MRRLERGKDPLVLGEPSERGEGPLVVHRDVPDPAGVLQVGVLRADAGVVQARRDALRLGDLSLVILQDVGVGPVKDPGPTPPERRRAARTSDRMTARIGGASLILVGVLMLSLAVLEFRWVGLALAAAGGILVLRGFAAAVLSLRND